MPIKTTQDEPYTIEESERAAGLGSYVRNTTKRKMETMLPEAVQKGESLEDVKKRAKVDVDDGTEKAHEN